MVAELTPRMIPLDDQQKASLSHKNCVAAVAPIVWEVPQDTPMIEEEEDPEPLRMSDV